MPENQKTIFLLNRDGGRIGRKGSLGMCKWIGIFFGFIGLVRERTRIIRGAKNPPLDEIGSEQAVLIGIDPISV